MMLSVGSKLNFVSSVKMEEKMFKLRLQALIGTSKEVSVETKSWNVEGINMC